MRRHHLTPRILTVLSLLSFAALSHADPLPSWNDGDNKQQIISFVESVSDPGSDQYVPEPQRIAVFDNDGTLWGEQPLYFQLLFAMDRAATLDSDLLATDAQKAAAQGDAKAMLEQGEQGLQEVFDLTHANLSVDDFTDTVTRWLDETTHPETNRRYDDMVYQPMLELLSFLRDKEFDTYIVSAGGLHFMRAFATQTYGIDPQNVIGSSTNTEVVEQDGELILTKVPGVSWYNDGQAKITAIDRHIGQRPLIAGGNSDGDVPMITWTTQGEGPRLGILIHHTDDEREVAYDRGSAIGGLEQGLDEAESRGWTLVDMKTDWRALYPETP